MTRSLDWSFSRARARARRPAEQGRANLFAVAQQLAARAATPLTREQYAAIYRSFGDWLRGELGRLPTVADLHGDVIAAYARHLETAGGRGGRPAGRDAADLPLDDPGAGARARAR